MEQYEVSEILDVKPIEGISINYGVDEYPPNPREWDNLGVMVCEHRDYTLGDTTPPELDTWEELEDYLIKEENAFIILPLYLYDHSGITMNTTGFSCEWDSGQVGYIYTTRDKIKKWFGVEKITKKIKEQAIKQLKAEVAIYSSYIEGEVYEYIVEITHPITGDTEILDSCGGYYGYTHIKETLKEVYKQWKDYKNTGEYKKWYYDVLKNKESELKEELKRIKKALKK